MFNTQMRPRVHSGRALPLACLGALAWATAYTPLYAQTAADAAVHPIALERSQRQTDNVYRWIKYFAEQPKRADANKPRAKAPATPQPVAAASAPKKPPTGIETTGLAVAAPDAEPPTPAVTPPPAAPSGVSSTLAGQTAPPADEPETVAVSDPPLVPIAVVEPSIPRELRNNPIDARVQLSFTVQKDGTVASPAILSGSNRRLNKVAIEAIKQWRFEPIHGDRLTQVEFVFKLE